MKKSMLGSVSLGAIALAGGAQAADLGAPPTHKAPVAAPAPFTWSGFYVGASIGAGSDSGSIANDPSSGLAWLPTSYNNNQTGVFGGLEAGYNWQSGNLVLGGEGDISASSLDRSVNIDGDPDSYSSKLDWLGTVRGRVGWAFDRTLVYGAGGVAFAGLKDGISNPYGLFTAYTSSGVTGWTAGGGVEYALSDHWTVKAEYLHVGFGDRTARSVATGYAFKFADSLDIGRVGVNYKF